MKNAIKVLIFTDEISRNDRQTVLATDKRQRKQIFYPVIQIQGLLITYPLFKYFRGCEFKRKIPVLSQTVKDVWEPWSD